MSQRVPAIDEQISTLDREVISNPDASSRDQNQALLRQLELLKERTVLLAGQITARVAQAGDLTNGEVNAQGGVARFELIPNPATPP